MDPSLCSGWRDNNTFTKILFFSLHYFPLFPSISFYFLLPSMRKLLFTLIALTFAILPTHASPLRHFLFPTTQVWWTTIVLDRLKGIYIIKPSSRELTFSAQWSTAPQLYAKQDSWTVLINAWYFWRDNSGFFPAGHFSLDPSLIDQSHCERDANLCGYIFTNSLTIQENLTFTKEPTIAAWPIMMLNGVVNKTIQQKTSHRTRKTYRTLLVQTKNWPVFIVTKWQFALDRLLAYTVKAFGRDISVINLDGWSSTTIRTDNPLFQHNGTRRLPTFFILK